MALCLQLQLSVGEFSARLRHAEGGSDVHATSVEETTEHLVGELVSCVGGCELIRRTPVLLLITEQAPLRCALSAGRTASSSRPGTRKRAR